MRTLKLTLFYSMRMRRAVAVVTAVLLVVMMGALIWLNSANEESVQYNLEGSQFVQRQVNDNVNFGFDYTGAFTVLAWAIALAIATGERRLLASMGASNWEWLVSLVLFSILQAAALTALSVLIGVLGRTIMMLMGMNPSEPWSANMILTGGRPEFWQDCLFGAVGMLRACSIASLIAVVFKRWWKVILVVFGAVVMTALALVIQVNVASYADRIVSYLSRVIQFLNDVLLPAIEAYYSNTSAAARLGRDLLSTLICFALCYPAAWHMKNA